MEMDLRTYCKAYNKITKTLVVRTEFLVCKSSALGPSNQAERIQFVLILKS